MRLGSLNMYRNEDNIPSFLEIYNTYGAIKNSKNVINDQNFIYCIYIIETRIVYINIV